MTTPFAIAAHRPTLLGSATPFFVAYMAAQRAHGAEPLFPDLRGCLAGARPITAELGRQVRETFSVHGVGQFVGFDRVPGRHLTADTGRCTGSARPDRRTAGGGVSVRVVDEAEREVALGGEGELRLKGPQCFLGYVDELAGRRCVRR